MEIILPDGCFSGYFQVKLSLVRASGAKCELMVLRPVQLNILRYRASFHRRARSRWLGTK
jgi:hypothetical protein